MVFAIATNDIKVVHPSAASTPARGSLSHGFLPRWLLVFVFCFACSVCRCYQRASQALRLRFLSAKYVVTSLRLKRQPWPRQRVRSSPGERQVFDNLQLRRPTGDREAPTAGVRALGDAQAPRQSVTQIVLTE